MESQGSEQESQGSLPPKNNAIDFFKFTTHDMDKDSFLPAKPRPSHKLMNEEGEIYDIRLGSNRSRRKNSSNLQKDKRAYFRSKYYRKTLKSLSNGVEYSSPWEKNPQKHSNFY